jgi:chorismate synthase
MSTFGTLYRVTTYGESHCASVGCIIDGVPPVRSFTRYHRFSLSKSRFYTPREWNSALKMSRFN